MRENTASVVGSDGWLLAENQEVVFNFTRAQKIFYEYFKVLPGGCSNSGDRELINPLKGGSFITFSRRQTHPAGALRLLSRLAVA